MTDTQQDNQQPEDAAAPEAPTASEASTEGQAPQVPSRTMKGRVWPWIGISIFAALSAMFALRSIEPASPSEATSSRSDTPIEVSPSIDTSLLAAELLELASDATAANQVDAAARLLEEARVRVEASNLTLQISIFDALSQNAANTGNTTAATAHRGRAAALRQKLGSALRYFNEGKTMLAEGHPRTARRYFAEFLLRAGSLSADAKTYIAAANQALTDIWVADALTHHEPQPLGFNVEDVIHD